MLSQAMQNKLQRIKTLIAQFNETLASEAAIEAKIASGNYSFKGIRELREDVNYQQKKIEEKIGSIWTKLSDKQRSVVFQLVEESDRWIFDGF